MKKKLLMFLGKREGVVFKPDKAYNRSLLSLLQKLYKLIGDALVSLFCKEKEKIEENPLQIQKKYVYLHRNQQMGH